MLWAHSQGSICILLSNSNSVLCDHYEFGEHNFHGAKYLSLGNTGKRDDWISFAESENKT